MLLIGLSVHIIGRVVVYPTHLMHEIQASVVSGVSYLLQYILIGHVINPFSYPMQIDRGALDPPLSSTEQAHVISFVS